MVLLYRHNTCPVCRGELKVVYKGKQGDTGARRNKGGKPRRVGPQVLRRSWRRRRN